MVFDTARTYIMADLNLLSADSTFARSRIRGCPVMAVICPYCQNSLNLQKTLKPGKYSPACPKCSRKLQVIVPKESDKPPTVRAIQAEREKWVTAPGPMDEGQPGIPSAREAPQSVQGKSPIGPMGSEIETVVAEAPQTPAFEPTAPADVPVSLGGYQVLKELG